MFETIETFERGEYFSRIFESFSELAEFATEETPDHNSWINNYYRSQRTFVGRVWDSWQHAADDACGVWSHGQKIVQGMREQLEAHELPKPLCRRRKLRWSEDSGDEICLDRMRAGANYWRESVKQQTRGPATIALLSSIGTSASWRWQDALWRGAAALVLADLLEAQGYRVELWAVSAATWAYTSGAENKFTACKIKSDRAPLDIATATACMSGWAYRSLWFKSFCNSKQKACSSLGTPHKPGDDQADFLIRGNAAKYTIGQFRTEADALAEVRRILQEFA